MKYGKIKNEKGLAGVRLKYGMSQQQLAGYLGITRGTLSKAEKGDRDLNTAALLKMSAFEISLEAAPPAAAPMIEATERLLKHCKKEKKFYRFASMRSANQVLAMQKKLRLLEERYEQCSRLLHMLTHMPPELDPPPAKPGRLSLRERQLEDVRRSLENCNPMMQAIMKVRIAHLEQEVIMNENSLRLLQDAIPAEYFGDPS